MAEKTPIAIPCVKETTEKCMEYLIKKIKPNRQTKQVP